MGIVFRGFILVNHVFKEYNQNKNPKDTRKDLRGSFISAISSFAQSTFNNNCLEYLESDKFLCIFKSGIINPKDSNTEEPLIIYGIVDKNKKTEKLVKKFLEKAEPVLNQFIEKYEVADLNELNQFQDFKYDMISDFL